jgi:hypothetical protein
MTDSLNVTATHHRMEIRKPAILACSCGWAYFGDYDSFYEARTIWEEHVEVAE